MRCCCPYDKNMSAFSSGLCYVPIGLWRNSALESLFQFSTSDQELVALRRNVASTSWGRVGAVDEGQPQISTVSRQNRMAASHSRVDSLVLPADILVSAPHRTDPARMNWQTMQPSYSTINPLVGGWLSLKAVVTAEPALPGGTATFLFSFFCFISLGSVRSESSISGSHRCSERGETDFIVCAVNGEGP